MTALHLAFWMAPHLAAAAAVSSARRGWQLPPASGAATAHGRRGQCTGLMQRARLRQGKQARERGSPFAVLNGATARDVACLLLPDGAQLSAPVHVLYLSTGAAPSARRATRCKLVHGRACKDLACPHADPRVSAAAPAGA